MKHRMENIAPHRMALYHMIGQLEDMQRYQLSTGEIAKMMGVSLPTAIKRLELSVSEGFLQKTVLQHRKNAKAYRWSLTKNARKRYDNGHFYAYYEMWKDEAFGGNKS